MIDIIIGESIVYDALGIAVGHIFYFFYDVYPNLPLTKGAQLLTTPRLL